MGTNSLRIRAMTRMPLVLFIAAAGSVGFGATTSHGAGSIRFVDGTAPSGGDGRSWDDAFTFLADALADAAGDPGVTEIRIAQGRYVPDQSHAAPGGTGDRGTTFEVRSDLAIIGGFAGNGSGDPNAWDPTLYESVLDGDLYGNDDALTGLGRDENAWTVVHVPIGGPGTRLSGVTVRGAYGDGPTDIPLSIRGGGVRVSVGSAVIEDCRIEENFARISGGGMYLGTGTHRIERTVFRGNGLSMPGQQGGLPWTAWGGGLIKGAGVLQLIDCAFVRNGGESGGGLSFHEGSHAYIDGTTFEVNIGGVGGAVRIGGANGALITNCRFIGNEAYPGPAAIFLFTVGDSAVESCEFISNVGGVQGAVAVGSLSDDVTPVVRHSSFIMNVANAFGGALSGDNLDVVNCLFSRNQSPQASALYVGRRMRVINSTFHDDTAPVVYNEGALPGSFIANSIVRSLDAGPAIVMDQGSLAYLAVHDSIVAGGWSGTGSNVIDEDPLFRNPGVDDLRLLEGSPALDGGNNMWLPPDLLDDLDGMPRIQNGVVDMGCFEGFHDVVAQAASIPYIPPGGEVVLVLEGGQPSVWTKRVIRVQNLTDDGAGPTIVTEFPPTGTAPGAAPLRAPLQIDTEMPVGSLLVRVSMPFTGADLDGALPAAADLMGVHPISGRWVRAPLVNADGALDARIVRLDGTMPPIPFTLGSYGLGWDPANERGFVAAMLDGPGIFAPAVATCPADIAGITDGMVNWRDIIFIVAQFNTGWGPADINSDGAVDLDDLTEALSHWGPCP